MQEIFKKIINDKVLEKAWQPLGTFNEHSPLVIKVSDVEKIVKQAAAEYSECYKECTECEAYDKEKHYCPKFCHVIQETIKEIKENNNNGWIPVESGKLPKQNEDVLATITSHGRIITVAITYFPEWLEGEIRMIAWQPLPEPYDQKGE